MSQENNFIPEQKPYKQLRPFQVFMKNNFPFIENTFEGLDYYSLLCQIVKYLNDVIANENLVEENNQALFNAFVQLNDYVSNYFDNLDVQEEINNKLDDMAEQGTLQEIITQYIQATALWVFDTVADMKAATNLVNGSYAKTLGYYSLNDGGGATYKIKTSSDSYYETIDENLVAELVNDEEFLDIKKIGCQVNTDITTKLNSIFTYYKKVLISDGTFLISQVHVPSNVHLKGTKNSLLQVIDNLAIESSTNYYILENILAENVTFDSLNIYGNSEHNQSFRVCDLITCVGENSKVINCNLEDAIDSAIMFSVVKDGVCSNNFIDTTRDCGIYVNSGTLGELKNCIISNNIIKNTGEAAIACKRICSETIISENMIYDCKHGITMENASTNIDFSTDISILNNYIKNMSQIGINIRGGKNHIISNNNLIDCKDRGIVIDSCQNSVVSSNVIDNTKETTQTYKGDIFLTVRNSDYPLKNININGNMIKSKFSCIGIFNNISANYDTILITNNILETSDNTSIYNYNGVMYNSCISDNISKSATKIFIANNIDVSDIFISNNKNMIINAQNYIQPAFILQAHTDSSNVNSPSRRIYNIARTEGQRNATRYKKGDIVFSHMVTGTVCYMANDDGIGSDVLVPLITLS